MTVPQWARASSFTRFLDHTQRRTTVGRTPLDEWFSPSQRPLPDNKQHSQQTNIHALGGIRNHNLSRREVADLRLRPRCHWDVNFYCRIFILYIWSSPTLAPVKETPPPKKTFYTTGHNIKTCKPDVHLNDISRPQIILMFIVNSFTPLRSRPTPFIFLPIYCSLIIMQF